MKALVTGGAGFIGSHLAAYLVSSGYDVIVLDNLQGGSKENIPPGVRFSKGSITDYETLKELFETEGFDFVYHLAAYAAESLSHYIRRFNYETNLAGSVNLVNLSILYGIKCFIFTSSIAVYGDQKKVLSEKSPLKPTDPYGIAKLATELDLMAAYKNFGLNSIIFRPHNIYGERQNINDPYRNVIGIFLKQATKGMPLTVFGDGEQIRSFTYIEDIIPVLGNAVMNKEAYNKTFNIGSDEQININDLVDLLQELMPNDIKKLHLQERNEAKQAIVSHSLVNRYFNKQCPTTLRTGLTKMIKWVSENKDIISAPQTRPIEIPKDLPEGWQQ